MTPPNFFVDKATGWLHAGWGLDLPRDEFVQLPARVFGLGDEREPMRPVGAAA